MSVLLFREHLSARLSELEPCTLPSHRASSGARVADVKIERARDDVCEEAHGVRCVYSERRVSRRIKVL